jgi:hypothetical protein
MRSFLLAAACVAATCLIGCGGGPKVAPVTGKVLHKGQSVAPGSIIFHPDAGNTWAGERPTSMIQLDGSFTMKTYPWGDGVPPGSYKVTLEPGLAGRLRKAAYGDVKKTPWTLDVPAEGVKDQLFEVK